MPIAAINPSRRRACRIHHGHRLRRNLAGRDRALRPLGGIDRAVEIIVKVHAADVEQRHRQQHQAEAPALHRARRQHRAGQHIGPHRRKFETRPSQEVVSGACSPWPASGAPRRLPVRALRPSLVLKLRYICDRWMLANSRPPQAGLVGHASDGRAARGRPHAAPSRAGHAAAHRIARAGAVRPLTTVTPAVTCTVQATFMTGALPRDHGIVANGWLFRDLMEVWLWRQSNRLVAGEKIWEAGKRRDPPSPPPTCSGGTTWAATPRHRRDAAADLQVGRPQAAGLLHAARRAARRADAALGAFPLFQFWGPATSIAASRWIADAALHVRRRARRP